MLDIKAHKQTAAELEARAYQQAGVAELGLRALESIALSTLMDEAVALIARTLEVEYCQILEFLPDENGLLLRAGVGWPDELIDQATVSTAADSQAGYTLHSGGPVLVEDLWPKDNLDAPGLVLDSYEDRPVFPLGVLPGDGPPCHRDLLTIVCLAHFVSSQNLPGHPAT